MTAIGNTAKQTSNDRFLKPAGKYRARGKYRETMTATLDMTATMAS
jgi:hypothetical protein